MTLSIIESRKWLTLPFRLGLNGGDNVRIRLDWNYSDYLFDRVDRTQSSVRGNSQDHHSMALLGRGYQMTERPSRRYRNAIVPHIYIDGHRTG
jgi:hypothetical protein